MKQTPKTEVPEKEAPKIEKSDLILQIIDEIKQDLTDEEIIHLLLDQKTKQKNSSTKDLLTFGQRAADGVASFVGSWKFIGCFAVVLVVWIFTNVALLSAPFDPYPFILLNLLLSMIAAIQAPLVMMSQNRQEEKDRLRAEDDYRVNLKTEIIIEDLHQKIESLSQIQDELKNMKSH